MKETYCIPSLSKSRQCRADYVVLVHLEMRFYVFPVESVEYMGVLFPFDWQVQCF